MKLRSILFALVALFIYSACSDTKTPAEVAQDRNEEKFEKEQLEEDAEFFVNYKHDLILSNQMAALAMEKSKDQRIREFAKTVMEDAQLLSDQLEKATATLGMILPKEISEEAKMEFDDFKEMTSEEFDEAYLEWFEDHNQSFMEGSKEVIAETNRTNSLLEVANMISAQAYAHNSIINEIQGDS